MEGITVESFDQICRTCFSKTDLEPIDCQPIDYLPSISELLLRYLDVRADENDPFPKNICFRCKDIFTKMYKFTFECTTKQKVLEEILSQFQNLQGENSMVDNKHIVLRIDGAAEEGNEGKKEKRENEEMFDNVQIKIEADGLQEEEEEEEVEEYKPHFDNPYYDILYCDYNDSNYNNDDDEYTADNEYEIEQVTSNLDSVNQDITEKQTKIIVRCTICQKRFINEYFLKVHSYTHTGEKPFKCKFCEKTFPLKCNLTLHIIVCERKHKIESNGENITNQKIVCEKKVEKVKNNGENITLTNANVVCESQEYITLPSVLENNMRTRRKSRSLELTLEQDNITLENNAHTKRKSQNFEHALEPSKQKKYKCNVCEKSYNFKHNLVAHGQVHSGKKFTCLFCDRTFTFKCNLALHLKFHDNHPETKILDSTQSHYTTQVVQNGIKTHSCNVCEKSFKNKSSLSKHHQKHNISLRMDKKGNVKQTLECTVCKRAFSYKASLINHNCGKLFNVKYSCKCSFCGKTFSSITNARNHERVHTGKKPFKCNFCGKRCNQKSNLKKHLTSVHKGKAPHKSNSSGKVFSQKTSFASHLKGKGKNQYKSNSSGKLISQKSNLASQKKIHLKQRPFKCTICGTGFTMKNNLFRHQRHSHGQEKDIRPKISSSKKNLDDINQDIALKYKQKDIPNTSEKTSECLYSCSICKKSFKYKIALSQHQMKHKIKEDIADNKEKTYTCNVCGKVFIYKANLIKHKIIHGENETYLIQDNAGKSEINFTEGEPCTVHVQSTELNDDKKVDQHQQNEESASLKESFKCLFCDKYFSNKNHVTIHEKVHTAQNVLDAELNKTKNENELNKDIGLKGHQTNYICEKQQNENFESGQKSFKCSYCEKSYAKKSHVANHERVHTGKRPHKCNVCGESFSQKANLLSHERIHPEEKPFKCKICKQCFGQKKALASHKRVHTNEKPREKPLVSHENTFPENPLTCKICKKTLSCKQALTSHQNMHNQIHKCSVCNKKFTIYAELKIHKRLHRGIKPHQCKFCKKLFVYRAVLVVHERIHTGVKPYACHICEKTFTQKPHLKNHSKIHTNEEKDLKLRTEENTDTVIDPIEKKYSCLVCDEAFPKTTDLMEHIKIHNTTKLDTPIEEEEEEEDSTYINVED